MRKRFRVTVRAVDANGVESEVGKGSTFHILLPFQTKTAKAQGE